MLPQNEIGRTHGNAAPVRLDKTSTPWVLRIDPLASFNEIRESVTKLLSADAGALRGRHLRLAWGDRILELLDVRRLTSQLRDEFQASVIAIECTADRIHQYAEHSFKLKFFSEGTVDPVRMPLGFVAAPLQAAPPDPIQTELPMATEPEPPPQCDTDVDSAFEGFADESATDMMPHPLDDAIPTDLPEADLADIQETEIIEVAAVFVEEEPVPAVGGRRALILDRTVRSGNVIRFAGDITIFGDVNAGAHIEADGNIIVMGALRGLAHAGARGDERAVILAFEFDAPQLRIASGLGFGGEIDRPPSMLDAPEVPRPRIPVGQFAQLLRRDRPDVRQYTPTVAWLEGGTIHLDTYNGRLPI